MKKLLSIILVLLFLCSCGNNKSQNFSSINDLSGKRVGILTGSFHDTFIKENYPDNNMNILYQNSFPELLISLKANKTDAFLCDEPIVNMILRDNDNLGSFTIDNSAIDAGFIFSEEALDILQDFNDFIKLSEENGFLSQVEDKWLKNYSDDTVIYKKEYKPTKRTIKAIISADSPPYCFISNNEFQGYCIDVINEFAYEYGYDITFDNSSFDSLISGVSTCKYDIGVNEISITDDRKENLNFSDPINSCSISVVYNTNNNNEELIDSVDDLVGTTMGCMSGSIYDRTIEEKIENTNIIYFNSRSELITGLKLNKISGYLADKPVAMVCCAENKGIKYLDESLEKVEYGFCFSDDAANIREQFNEYLSKVNADGSLKELQDKWFIENATEQTIEEIILTGENGTIKACTTPDAAPFSFIKNNKYEGYETELITKFAYEYGYDLEITNISFDAIISAISSNKYDVAFNGIYITEERKESVDFSNPTYGSDVVAVVRSGEVESKNIIDTLTEKFYKTFIEEERYKIIIDGIITTLSITIASLFFGTLFGFIIFLLSRKIGKWFIKLSDAMAYLISGMPVVVLLMVLFYIIFAQSSLSGTIISIVGFSLIVCYSVYGMLKTGVGAIDKGQFEGALALGYTDNQTLFKFILPQAFRIIMPSYRNEIVSLIKSSSVVGYVTVEDLTRASDLIRSRTYDAFFPLIVTAILYFVMAGLITRAVNKIQIKYLPNEKTKEEILKSLKK